MPRPLRSDSAAIPTQSGLLKNISAESHDPVSSRLVWCHGVFRPVRMMGLRVSWTPSPHQENIGLKTPWHQVRVFSTRPQVDGPAVSVGAGHGMIVLIPYPADRIRCVRF